MAGIKKILLLSFYVFSLAAVGTAAWFLRELSYPEGQVHVVNSLEKDLSVSITFPSGENEQFEIKSESQHNFKVRSTGEGSIKVKINHQDIPCDSYVTSMNPLIVLTLKEDKALFTIHTLQKND